VEERISNMQSGNCELYRPPDAMRVRPSCEAEELLSELYGLLEDYAPEWYTEKHHAALRTTLEKMNRMKC
jgi:hypothetical protein